MQPVLMIFRNFHLSKRIWLHICRGLKVTRYLLCRHIASLPHCLKATMTKSGLKLAGNNFQIATMDSNSLSPSLWTNYLVLLCLHCQLTALVASSVAPLRSHRIQAKKRECLFRACCQWFQKYLRRTKAELNHQITEENYKSFKTQINLCSCPVSTPLGRLTQPTKLLWRALISRWSKSSAKICPKS